MSDDSSAAVALSEEDVIVLTAVKRRVEVDEVNRLILDVPAQDLQIVAVIESVLFHRARILTRMRRLRNVRIWYAVRDLDPFHHNPAVSLVSHLSRRVPQVSTFTERSGIPDVRIPHRWVLATEYWVLLFITNSR
jgi:hypothetical protein